MPEDTGVLRSTFKNLSGEVRFFPYLPPYGQELAINETFTVYGSPTDCVSRGYGETARRRRLEALDADMSAGRIGVQHSAAIIMEARNGTPKKIVLNDANVLTVVNLATQSDSN